MRLDRPLRVLIVSDSAVFARALAAEIDGRHGIHALCVSGDIVALREQLLQYHPDVILLDVTLRALDALGLLRRLRQYYPVPVIVAADDTARDADRALRAARGGALDIVRKPLAGRGTALRAFAADLITRIRTLATVAQPALPIARAHGGGAASWHASGLRPAQYIVAIGASTGGTSAIETLLRRVPPDFPATVIVQHMPADFTRSFAARLSSLSTLSVSEAVDGENIGPGRAVVARGDTHLTVRRTGYGWSVHYAGQDLVNRHCPSVDVLFESVAAAAGERAVGILMTGMGADGAQGLLAIRRAGGVTVAQSKESCVVFGMPKVAMELGATTCAAAPDEMPARVLRAILDRQGAFKRP